MLCSVVAKLQVKCNKFARMPTIKSKEDEAKRLEEGMHSWPYLLLLTERRLNEKREADKKVADRLAELQRRRDKAIEVNFCGTHSFGLNFNHKFAFILIF